MAKDALFRNSLGGYNKNDVTRYIEELNVQYTDRGNELESEIRQLKKELEILPSLKEQKAKAEKLSSKVDALKKENVDLSDAIKAQGEELEEKKKEITKLTSEKDTLELRVLELSENEQKLISEKAKLSLEFEEKTKQLKHLSDETDALKASLEEEKAEFERRAEEMLVEIQNQAKAVIDKANETAELIVNDAKKKAAEVSAKPVSSPVSSTAVKKKDGFSDILDSHKARMDSFFAAISKTLKGENK